MPLPPELGACALGEKVRESQANATADAARREGGAADACEEGYGAWEGYSLDILTALLDD